MTEQKDILKEDEIDMIELVRSIWAGRKLILKITSIFIVLGLIIAFTSKIEYSASCKLLPESQEGTKSSLGGLGSLAGLAGINLDLATGGSLSPELYPEIINSLPNQLEIINDTLDFESKELHISSFDYFKNYEKPSLLGYIAKYTLELPITIKSWFSSNEKNITLQSSNIYRLKKEEWNLIEAFKERINIDIDSKSGLINIRVEMPDPLAAAQLTNIVVQLMTEKVIEYKIEKVKNNLDFIQNAHKHAETKFLETQKKLAFATDRNKHINSASANIELQTLQNQYNLAFEVYKGLASQFEQAKIKLKEETPVFTMLEPVRVPESKSKPRRVLILMAFCIIGVIVGISYQTYNSFIKENE